MKKVVVITGASSGLGKELAKLYIKKGAYSLILSGQNEKGLEEFKNNPNVTLVVGDLTKKETLVRIEKVAREIKKRVDIIINNAGITFIQPFEKNTEKQLEKLLAIDLKAPILLTQRLYNIMTTQKSGLIVNINSTAGKEGKENHTLYCAAKWGLSGFTQALRIEAKKHNIRIISVHPGGIDTPLYDKLEKHIDTTSYMDPKKVAEIIVYLTETSDVAPDEIIINRLSKL